MNIGERDELVFKIIMTYKRDHHLTLFDEPVTSVGFADCEYGTLPSDFEPYKIRSTSDSDIQALAESININKAPAGAKADIYINHIGYSLKSLAAAPAALVNHTARPGFAYACQNAGVEIETLDLIVDNYWEKRISGIITEDVRNSNPECPFREHKEYMKPILEYFLFDGTGSRLSAYPAEYVIEFSNPVLESTYTKLSKSDAVDAVWPKLIFSLRSKKGMPKDYSLETYRGKNAESIAKWVRFLHDDYRGALHIRSTK